MIGRVKISGLVKRLLGLVIAIASLVWAFADVDRSALWQALRSARMAWLVASVLSVFVTVALVVWRWWFLLDRPTLGPRNEPPWWMLWHATIAAQVANIVVPFRLGDGVRIVTASEGLGLGTARAVSAAVIERIADVAALGAIGAALAFTSAVPDWAQAAVTNKWRLALIVAGVAVVAVVIASWIGAKRLTVLPSRSALWWTALGSIAVPAGSVLTNFLVVRAFDLPVPFSASVLLLVMLQAGTSIIAVPGGLGVSQVLTVKTLEIWHVAPAESLALSIVLYAVSRVPKLFLLPFAMAAVGRYAVKPAEA